MKASAARSALRRLLPLFAAAASILAAAPAPTAEAPATTAGALIDRVLAAHGGKEALSRVKAYRMEGTLTSSMRGTGPFVRLFSRPERLRVHLDYPNHPETRILDGTKGWRSDGKGNLLPSEGFLLASMTVQAARANLPWILDEKRAGVRLLDAVEGRQGLEVPLGPGLGLTAVVELATGRIVRVTTSVDVPGMKTGFATDYADFRAVDGVLFPFREGNFASGQTTGDTTITKVTVNPPASDADFRP